MPNPVVAVVGGAAVIGGAIYSSSQSKKASDAQIDAAKDATALSVAEQRRQFDISMEAIAPWRASGVAALNRLNTVLGLSGPDGQLPGATNQLPGATTTTGGSIELTHGAYMTKAEKSAHEANIGAGGTVKPGDPGTATWRLGRVNPSFPWAKENPVAFQKAWDDLKKESAAEIAKYETIQQPPPAAPPPAAPPPADGTTPPDRGIGLGDHSIEQTGQDEMLNALRDLPGYQFSQQENESAIARAASARGMTRSGAYDKEILRRSQGLADQNYVNYLNPYFNLAGMGQVSAGQMASGSQQLGNNLSSLYMNQGAVTGNARASNYANQANIWGNALNNLAGGAMYYGS